MKHNLTPLLNSPLARVIAVGLLALSLAACATQRYGRMTPISPAERASLNCEQIAIEIDKASFFIEDVRRQRGETTGAHVLGALGDFGIGNVMEGDAAEKSGMDRYHQLKVLQGQKGCATAQVSVTPAATSTAGTQDVSNEARPCDPLSPGCTQQETRSIATREDFETLVVDRPITGPQGSENYMIHSDGTMTGTLNGGAALSGLWYFDDGYFCREVIANTKSYGWNCQVVSINGNEVTFVRDLGKGEKRKYVIK